jgi:hypothetical protein
MDMAFEHVTSGDYTFSQHQALAQAWCRWNGQKGTEKQSLRVMRQLTAANLVRMLGERGVVVTACRPLTSDDLDGGARDEDIVNAGIDY